MQDLTNRIIFLYFMCTCYRVRVESINEEPDSSEFMFRWVVGILWNDGISCGRFPVNLKVERLVVFGN